MEQLLTIELLNNSIPRWLGAIALGSGALGLSYLVRRIAVSRLAQLAAQTTVEWDDALVDLLSRTHALFLLIVAVFVGSLMLRLPEAGRQGLFAITAATLVLQGGIWANGLIMFWSQRDAARRRTKDPASVATVNAMAFVGRLILWSVVLLLVLDNLGFDVTALLAGLGVGGVAVALAVQNILGDLFASLSIVLDKPFTVGDFLVLGEFLGSVEHIGLKTTRLRSLSGEQLVFSNADLLGSRIRNYGRMFERRVVFKIGVTYQTPREKLARIPGMIRAAIEEQDNTRFDRSHFQAYGDFSLNFENVYYVLSPDYNLYMDIQQAINLRIHQQFEQEGIDFAYPTHTVFIAREASERRQH